MSMEVDSGQFTTLPAGQTKAPATILCCECGAPINGYDAIDSLCSDCVKLQIDLTQGVQREAVLHICRDCDRWMSPPNQWIMAALESRELLSLCLRKLRGLSKVRIIDASFIWTEPHSRRIKVKITVQSEVSGGAILQQSFEVEFAVHYHQCPDCAKSYTHNTWRANVQVRQKVPHKRTFLYLEQLILKNGAHKDTINIKEVDAGIDFFFSQRNHAEKFVDFLTSVVPCKSKKSQQLISMDVHTSTKSYKFNFSIEIVPVCKDDMVALPLDMARKAGNINPLTLCHKVGTAVYLLDPQTLQTADITPPVFWRNPFSTLADVRELTEFTVMDIEPLGQTKGRYVLAEATVRRTADLGVNDDEFTVKTHLGAILHPGDTAMGYHITGTNFNSPEFEAINDSKTYGSTVPDVILVKKSYPRRKKNKGRNWKLKRMAMEEEGEVRRKDQSKEEMDYEMFLRDVEEDEEMRGAMDLYRAEMKQEQEKQARNRKIERMDGVERTAAGNVQAADMARQAANADEEEEDDDEDDEDDEFAIPMDQLRSEMEDMTMRDEEDEEDDDDDDDEVL